MSRHIEPRPGGGQEGGEKSEFPEITAELLAKLILSREFLSRVSRAWKISNDISHEAGFVLGLNLPSHNALWGKVLGSDHTGAGYSSVGHGMGSSAKVLEQSLGENYRDERVLPLVMLHTHPHDSLGPSEGDFQSLLVERRIWSVEQGIHVYPTMAIVARPLGGKGINILLVQETPRPTPRSSEVAGMMYSRLENDTLGKYGNGQLDPEEELSLLNKLPQIKCVILRFEIRGKTIKPLQSKEEIAALLKDFAFQPKPVSSEE